MVADRRSRIHDHDWEPFPSLLQRNLFGEPLGTFVMAHHVLQSNGRVLISIPILRHTDAPHGAGIDNAFDPGALRSFQQIARAVHIRAIQILRMFRPEAIIRGYMKNELAALDSARKRLRIAKIARDALDLKFAYLAPRTAKSADVMTALQ